MPVMSIRLSEKELKRLKALAKEEDKEKSSLARELLANGLKYKMLLAY
jgi:predicted DNA-binding protein